MLATATSLERSLVIGNSLVIPRAGASLQRTIAPVTRALPPARRYAITRRILGGTCMRVMAALASIALLAASVPASAQSWPQRPVTFIVSQSAGASPDVMARMIASKLGGSLGQQVI